MTLLFIGTTELLLISGVALLFFGGKKLPEVMRGLGQGIKQFKEGMKDMTDSVDEDVSNQKCGKPSCQIGAECGDDKKSVDSQGKEQNINESQSK